MDALSRGLQGGILLLLVVSVLVVRALDRPDGRWGRRLRSRLLVGIPWGTLVTVLFVATVYLGLQQGYRYPRAPLHIPFTSWSYFYPLGLLTAPFSHQSLSHVTGNLLGTLALAPLAEYAFSHFPRDRGSSAFDGWRSNPYARAFVFFPAGVVGVGLLTSLFAWGPIIGFSGVVFAFAGFSLVRFPLATVVALAGRDLVGTLYTVLRNPIVEGSASSSFGPPWWAGIAIQGHLLGFLLGALLAAALLATRSEHERPSALRLWAGGLLVGSNMTLWAVWWYRDAGGYVLYRGVGVALVIAVTIAVVLAVRATDRSIVGRVTTRQIAIAVLTLPILTMGFAAVPLNSTVVTDEATPGNPIQVDGYEVTYAEDVQNQRVGAIDLTAFGESTRVNSSGVIVVDSDRTVWTEAISRDRLAFAGERTVKVGGIGESTTITAKRTGWKTVGGPTAYQISLQPEDGRETWVYAADPATAEPTIAGYNVTITPENGDFSVAVTSRNRTVAASRLPDRNESVTLATLTLENDDGRLIATRNDTRVRVAGQETYD
ncbi:MAG: rhomboid family intramembrane serine protease [Halanaeroarchaeum sp.]